MILTTGGCQRFGTCVLFSFEFYGFKLQPPLRKKCFLNVMDISNPGFNQLSLSLHKEQPTLLIIGREILITLPLDNCCLPHV